MQGETSRLSPERYWNYYLIWCITVPIQLLLLLILYFSVNFLLPGGFIGNNVPSQLSKVLEQNQLLAHGLFLVWTCMAFAINRFFHQILKVKDPTFRTKSCGLRQRIAAHFVWKNAPEETIAKTTNQARNLCVTILLAWIAYVVVDITNTPLVELVNSGLNFEAYETTPLVIAGAVVLLGLIALVFNGLVCFYIGRVLVYSAARDKDSSRRLVGYLYSFKGILPFISLGLGGIFITMAVDALGLASFAKIARGPKDQLISWSLSAKGVPTGHLEVHHMTRFMQMGILCVLGFLGANWFIATGYYSLNLPWYEWMFYFILGVLVFALPTVFLLLARGSHTSVRFRKFTSRLFKYLCFMLGFFGIIYCIIYTPFTDSASEGLAQYALENFALDFFFSGRMLFTNIQPLAGYDLFVGKPVALFLLYMGTVTCFGFWVFLKRGFNLFGLSNTDLGSKSEASGPSRRIRMRSAGFICFLSFAIVLSGLGLTWDGLGAVVHLEKPAGHHMRVSFYASEPSRYSNATLDNLSAIDARLYIWGPGSSAESMDGLNRAGERGIDIYCVIGGGGGGTFDQWNATLQDKLATIENPAVTHNPVKGFMWDIEEMASLKRFNRTWYDMRLSEIDRFIKYVNSLGYEMTTVAYMMPINDLRDGDADIAITNRDPFEFMSADGSWMNFSCYNWMVYRAEAAINYEEPFEYSTYLWALQIRNYLLDAGGPALLARGGLSLGVTDEDNNDLFTGTGTHSSGFQEIVKDVRICHALEFPEVIIFLLGSEDGDSFLGMYGNDSIAAIANYASNYTSFDIPFHRQASFLGNLKYTENWCGSVFGNYFLDVILNDWWIYFAFGWIFIYFLVGFKHVLQRNARNLKK